MKNRAIWLIPVISITVVIYLFLAFWLYFQDKADTTGWSSIGIIAFSLVFVIPIYSAIIGVVGQLVFKKIWISPLINSLGVSLFIVTLVIFMKDVKPIVLVIIPAVFIITIAISFITKMISKIFPGKNKAIAEVSVNTSVKNTSEVTPTEVTTNNINENSSDVKSQE